MRTEYFFTAARWLFGAFYLVMGIYICAGLADFAAPPTQPNPDAAAFVSALTRSGFIDPLIAITCLLGGGLTLIRRTVPLGLVLLSPLILVIFLFHIVLSGQWIWGTLNLLWLIALAWRVRHSFSSLWH